MASLLRLFLYHVLTVIMYVHSFPDSAMLGTSVAGIHLGSEDTEVHKTPETPGICLIC